MVYETNYSIIFEKISKFIYSRFTACISNMFPFLLSINPLLLILLKRKKIFYCNLTYITYTFRLDHVTQDRVLPNVVLPSRSWITRRASGFTGGVPLRPTHDGNLQKQEKNGREDCNNYWMHVWYWKGDCERYSEKRRETNHGVPKFGNGGQIERFRPYENFTLIMNHHIFTYRFDRIVWREKKLLRFINNEVEKVG